MRINYQNCHVVLTAKPISLLGGFSFINQLEDREADLRKRKITHLNAESGTIVQ